MTGQPPISPPAPEARELPSGLFLRRARTPDVAAIRALVEPLAEERILVAKDPVNYFESLQEFWLVVDEQPDGSEILAGCAALHIIWADLAEVQARLAIAADASAFAGSDLVVEAVPEIPDLKKKLLASVAQVAPGDVAVTSTAARWTEMGGDRFSAETGILQDDQV